MATNFPTSLDTLTNPQGTDNLDNPDHAGQHANANDAIEALEAKVGVDSSAVTTSHDYKLSGVTGSDKAVSLTGTETLTNKTLTAPTIATITNGGTLTLPSGTDTLVGRATTDTLTNKTLDGAVIATSLDMNGLELILDADADTSFTADTDDQIDIKIAGADDFQFTANTFTALSGSTIATDTIAETTSANGVTIDGLSIKDGKLNTNDSVVTSNITDEAVTAAKIAALPSAKGVSSGTQTIANNSDTAVTFLTSEDWDTDTMHDTVTNPGRLTATTAGKYLVTGSISWTANGTGNRSIRISKNAGASFARQVDSAPSTNTCTQSVAGIIDMVATDYVEIHAFQTSGGNLDLTSGYITAHFLGA